MKSRTIWNIGQTRKVKVKEIREWAIKGSAEAFVVEVYGFFIGDKITVFQGTIEECRAFIDEQTEKKEEKETKNKEE